MELLLQEHNEEQPYRNVFSSFSKNHYKAASHAAKTFDTKPLEYVINQYSSSDLPSDFIKDMTKHLYKIADYIGLTKKAIKSDSMNKLEKQKRSIDGSIQETNSQIEHVNERISMLNDYIFQVSDEIEESLEQITNTRNNLSLLKHQEQEDAFSFSHKSYFSSNAQLYQQEIERYRLCIEMQEQSRESFFEDKLYEQLSLSVLHSDLIILNSLEKQVTYYMKRFEHTPIINTLSRAKINIGSSYNVEQDLLSEEKREIKKYNNALSGLPSFKDLQENIVARKKNRIRFRF